MKKKLLLIILCLLFIPSVKAFERVEVDGVPTSTYIIGNYMFTRDKNDVYNGALTTKMIMLAAKSIEGNTLDDMIVYYRKVNGDWIDGLTGTNVNLPDFFDITNVNMQTWEEFSTKSYYDTKVVNGKTLNLEYRLSISDNVTGDLYINDNLVVEDMTIYSCGTGACYFDENINALNNFKPSDIETGIINGDEEYLYFILNSSWESEIIVVDDTGNKIFNEVSSTYNKEVYDCADKEFFENSEAPYLIENGTPDMLYYIANSDDGWHMTKMKVTFENSQSITTKVSTCTAKPAASMLDLDLEWYEDTKISKTLNVDGQMETFTIGYYPAYRNPKGNEIVLDLIYDDMIIYSTKYVGTAEDEFDRTNMLEIVNQYKLDTIGGESNDEIQGTIDYLYLTELKENGVSGGATYITILDHLEEGFDIRTFGPIASIKVSEAGQGITPLETHPRYNNYLETGGLSYCVIGNEIYYLVQAPGTEDKAVELKISIGKNGQINQENLGLVDVTIEGAI